MIIKHELRQSRKSLLIWAISVGLGSALCILLYESVADSMKDISSLYQDMGGVSKAFGMDKVSIATLSGYYAAEIALIYTLGAAMFGALSGVDLLAKEEEGHTAEFLLTLPLGRQKVVNHKYISLLINSLLFNLIAISLEWLALLKVDMPFNETAFIQYHLLVLLLQVEIGSLTFAFSALFKKKMAGLGMGLVLLMYFMDMICRIVEHMDYVKYLTPFYYANATDRFANTSINWTLIVIAFALSMCSVFMAKIIYAKRDINT
ncbi:ABC transporter permease subunit [Streptococcus iniae]